MTCGHVRFAVGDYDDAKQWLWTYSKPYEWLDADPDDLPLEARLVCDTFWVTPETLLRDLRRAWNETLAPARPAPFRRSCRAGWR